MNHKKKIVDNLIQEYFGNIQTEIKKEVSEVKQEAQSKGMYKSTVCTNLICNVYSHVLDSKVEKMVSYVQNNSIRPNWEYLNAKTQKKVEEIYESGKSEVVAHLTQSGLGLQKSFQDAMNKKKEETSHNIHNKLSLLEYSIDEKQPLNDRIISIIKHNPVLVWGWALLISLIALIQLISLIFSILRWWL